MGDWKPDENPYLVLGLTFESTKDDIKKSYRRLVLEKHPDKQPGNKAAAQEFIKLQRAYEVLNDEKAKEAWDAWHRAESAREAKHAGQSQKRRKMAEDLEKREREYEVERGQEQAARSRLNAELARLRKEIADREAERRAAHLREQVAASLAGAAGSSGRPMQHDSISEEKQRSLKVTWDTGPSSYTEAQLRDIFAKHGSVEDLIIRQPKKKGKGSALIIMRSIEGAAVAADVVSGRLDNPLLVVPMAKVPAVGQPEVSRPHAAPHFGHTAFPRTGNGGASVGPLFPAAGDRNGNGAAPLFPGSGMAKPAETGKPVFGAVPHSFFPAAAAANQTGETSSGALPTFGSIHTSFESDILRKMRQKAETERSKQGAQQKS